MTRVALPLILLLVAAVVVLGLVFLRPDVEYGTGKPSASASDAPAEGTSAVLPPVEPPPRAVRPLRGTVVSAKGAPVGGALVSAWPLDADFWVKDPERAAPHRAECDEKGRFAFAGLNPGPYMLEARAGDDLGYRPLVGVTGDGGPDVTIQLGESAAIEGWVRSEDGVPVEGASVSTDLGGVLRSLRAALALSDVPLGDKLECVTDSGGRFRISPLPPGEYDLEVTAPGFLPQVAQLVAAPVTDVAITVLETRTARGQVRPFLGGKVRIWTEPYPCEVRMGTEGTFTLHGLVRGRHVVRASSANWGTAHAELEIEAGREPEPVLLDLVLGGRVDGTVRDGDTGRRIDGAEVVFSSVSTSLRASRLLERLRVAAKKGGRFSARLGPGAWVARATKPGYMAPRVIEDRKTINLRRWYGYAVRLPGEPLPQEVFHVVEGRSNVRNLTLLATRRITGRVLYDDGWPVEGEKISVRARSWSGHEKARLTEAGVETDAAGRFVIDRLVPASEFSVQVTGLPERRVTIPEGKGYFEAHVVFRIPRPTGRAIVRGRVVDDQSRPVAGAAVIFTSGVAVTKADGRFEMGNVPDGWHRLRYLALSYALGVTELIKVHAGEVLELPALVLQSRSISVRGRVHDKSGQSIAGATVRVKFAGVEQPLETVTGPDGRYEQRGPGVEWGGASVTVDAPGYGVQSRGIRTAPAAETADLELTELGAIRGKLEYSGAGPRYVRVAFEVGVPAKTGAQWLQVRVLDADLAKDGRSFTVRGVDRGKYHVRILAEGFAYAPAKASVTGVGDIEDLGPIRLEPGGVIEGRVPDPRGFYKRIEVAEHGLSSVCDSEGRFRIENVPAGTVRIRQRTMLKYTGAELEVEVRAGRTTRVTFMP